MAKKKTGRKITKKKSTTKSKKTTARKKTTKKKVAKKATGKKVARKKATTKKVARKGTKKTAAKKSTKKKTTKKKTAKAAVKKAAKKATRKKTAGKTAKKTVKKTAKKATAKKSTKKKAAPARDVPVKKLAKPKKPRRTKHAAPPEVERPIRPTETEAPVTPTPVTEPPTAPAAPAPAVEETPKVQTGDWAPTFELQDQSGQMHSLWQYRGQWLTLYFYPKDDTPGCTTEACGFRDAMAGFTDRNTAVLGISPDDAGSHQRFMQKYSLTFPLLADEGHDVAEKYGVWVEKNMYGQKKMGIARTTFVINPEGRVAHVFRNVKADGHEQQVLQKLNELQSAG